MIYPIFGGILCGLGAALWFRSGASGGGTDFIAMTVSSLFHKTIFGYVSEGQYVKHKNKAYDISGGNYEFMADVTVNGNNVEIVKTYGDGVSSESTYEEMPFRYRFKISNYDPYDSNGYCKVAKEADKKAKKILGVPVETKYTLSIDGDKYEIYDIDTEGNVDTIETGEVDDL